MLLRRSPQNPCYVGILAGEGGLRPTALSALGFHVTNTYMRAPVKVTVWKKSQAGKQRILAGSRSLRRHFNAQNYAHAFQRVTGSI